MLLFRYTEDQLPTHQRVSSSLRTKHEKIVLNVFIPSKVITFNVHELLQNLIKERFLHFSFLWSVIWISYVLLGKVLHFVGLIISLNGHQTRQCLLRLKFCKWHNLNVQLVSVDAVFPEDNKKPSQSNQLKTVCPTRLSSSIVSTVSTEND